MAWDRTLPADTSKLRVSPGEMRNNWEAIEDADSSFKPEAINLIDRTASVVPIDPVAVAGSVVLYSKQDAASKPQIFSIDPDSVITQITGYGSIKAWGMFNGAAPGIAPFTPSYNISDIARTAEGKYTITFTNALSDANYAVVITTQLGSAALFTPAGLSGVNDLKKTGFKIFSRNAVSPLDGIDLNPVSFAVIGV